MLNKTNVYSNGFEYVVERKEQQKICFGSTVERDSDPIGKGLSPFQRHFIGENNVKVSPQTYATEHLTSGVAVLSNKIRSKRGVGSLASATPRCTFVPYVQAVCPTRYDPEPFIKTFKQNKVPFNSNIKRKTIFGLDTPGVGTYNTSPKRCRRVQCASNFGKPTLQHAVEVICTPIPPDRCEKCGGVCNNDYWQKDHTVFLCHACMEEEKCLHELFTTVQLWDFKKIRICSFVHSHEGVNASIKLLTGEQLKKRERLENYLNMYL